MIVVQLALPPLVRFLFAYALVEPARSLNLPTARSWPHSWPIWTQAILMVLAVDFMRYWLHRAAHESDTLWRLHSVHHSVEQLYWLNTARFHPIEKALQMCLDSLPFLLMGVDATGARSVLPRLRVQRLLPALQRPLALRLPELHRRQRRDAPLASFARAARANATTATRSSCGTCCSGRGSCRTTARSRLSASRNATIRRLSRADARAVQASTCRTNHARS